MALKKQETIFKHFLVEIMNLLLGKIYENSNELIIMPAGKKKKTACSHSLVEQSRKLSFCLFVRSSSSACIVMFVFDVEVTNNLKFWTRTPYRFLKHNYSGKTDKKNHLLGSLR